MIIYPPHFYLHDFREKMKFSKKSPLVNQMMKWSRNFKICSPETLKPIMVLICMTTIAGASEMSVMCRPYLILVIFDDLSGHFSSTFRYRTNLA